MRNPEGNCLRGNEICEAIVSDVGERWRTLDKRRTLLGSKDGNDSVGVPADGRNMCLYGTGAMFGEDFSDVHS